MHDAGKRIKEHYADTGEFTAHVFVMCALLGYQFSPRLRNLSSLTLYDMDGVSVHKSMKELITAKANRKIMAGYYSSYCQHYDA